MYCAHYTVRTVLYCTYCTVLTALYVLYCFVICNVLYCPLLNCFALWCTVCTILCCTVMYCAVLYCLHHKDSPVCCSGKSTPGQSCSCGHQDPCTENYRVNSCTHVLMYSWTHVMMYSWAHELTSSQRNPGNFLPKYTFNDSRFFLRDLAYDGTFDWDDRVALISAVNMCYGCRVRNVLDVD